MKIITLTGQLDFEKAKQYEMNVKVSDHGNLTDSCKVIIEVMDVNDNAPVITLMSFSNPIPENSAPGTVIALAMGWHHIMVIPCLTLEAPSTCIRTRGYRKWMVGCHDHFRNISRGST
uniref:Cadherin domain-containing protein n=1 Tax=Paramormyrops kingsleyae TaxID=1676925 RepID=A0A3B3T7K1_9TELE